MTERTLFKEKLAILGLELEDRLTAKVVPLSNGQPQALVLFITHAMKDAIAHGNRLIMMNEGCIILDIGGEEKKNLTI